MTHSNFAKLQCRQKTLLLSLLDKLLIDGNLLRVDLLSGLVALAGRGITATESPHGGIVHLGKSLTDEPDTRSLALEVETARRGTS